LSHLGATRLRGELNGEDILALRVADKVDNDHLRGDLLLLGDQVDWQFIFTKSCLNSGQVELVDSGPGVSAKADAESIEVFVLCSIDQSSPRLHVGHLGDTSPVDHTTLFAFKGLVTWLVAKLALHGIGGAATSSMTFFTASIAGSGEWALDTRVGTIGLVVADFTAVEALASQTATAFGFLGAVTSEMACLCAAVKTVSMYGKARVG
jgi:hypothetical protein